MESQARYVLVGSFVLIATVLFVAALLWLAEMTGGRDVERYTAYFSRQSLDGLQKDADVTMKGIKVGSVEDYQISSSNIEEVKVRLRLDEFTPVKKDTEVVIRRNLLTGLAWIDLVHGTQESPLLKKVPTGEEFPVIPEGRSELDVITDSIPTLLEHINDMIAGISKVFSSQNINNVSSILENVNEATVDLDKSRKRLNSLMSEAQNTLVEIRKMSSSANRLAGKTNAQVDKLGDKLALTLNELEETVEGINKETSRISRSVRTTSQVLSQEITSVGQSISEAAQSFSKTMESFEDPQTIIAGPREKALGPGERIEK